MYDKGNSYDDIIQNYIMYQQMGIDTNTAAQYYQQAQASSTTPQNQSSNTFFFFLINDLQLRSTST
jgi:hypothetical protein